MAETDEDQQDSVAQNEDRYEPQDQTLEPEQYEPQDKFLEPKTYDPQAQNLEPHHYKSQEQSLESKRYDPQAQNLEFHQHKPQEQSLEPKTYDPQAQALELHQSSPQEQPLEPQDQKENQESEVQEQAHKEMQDQPLTNPQNQPEEQDHEQYQLQVEARDDQMEGEAEEHNGGEAHNEVADEGGTSKHVESSSPLKSKLEDEEKRRPGWPGVTVFRMLIPAKKAGKILGHKGDVIKKIVEETKARVKILDGPPDATEVVMIYAKEEPESSLPPSINALLRVHSRIIDGLNDSKIISTRLLVPESQSGILIGKQWSNIKAIEEETGSSVIVHGEEYVPDFSLQDDRVVEIVGKPSSVHESLKLIASHLRKFLVDRSMLPFFETQMKRPSMDPASRMHPPPLDKQSHGQSTSAYRSKRESHDQSISATYRKESPMNLHVSTAPSMAAHQISQQMHIPLSYTDVVIGSSGTNIDYIRRNSGATVNIQETIGVPDVVTVDIRGTRPQVNAAQELIQNAMAAAPE